MLTYREILLTCRIGSYIVAIGDVLSGLVAIIAISVIWNHQRTPIPLFGGEAYPYLPGPGEVSDFLDDPNKSQYFLMGLVVWVICAFTFGLLLMIGVYRNKILYMKIWKLCNILGVAVGFVFLLFVAHSKYSVWAMFLSFPLAFRLFQVWIVMSYVDTYEKVQEWESAQQRRNIAMAAMGRVNGDAEAKNRRQEDEFANRSNSHHEVPDPLLVAGIEALNRRAIQESEQEFRLGSLFRNRNPNAGQ